MATIPLSDVEIFGQGALHAEGVVIEKDGLAYETLSVPPEGEERRGRRTERTSPLPPC
jgi:hypothetical protein